MKRLLLGALSVFVFTTAFAVQPIASFATSVASTAEAAQDPATITVFVTRTGEKYHRDGCQYLRHSRIATTLREAVNRGFGPCSVCRPPTAR